MFEHSCMEEKEIEEIWKCGRAYNRTDLDNSIKQKSNMNT